MADLSITDYDRVLTERLKLLKGTTIPTGAAGANAGTSPPAPVVAATAADSKGTLTFGSGSSPAAGQYVVVTFNKPYAVAPNVQINPTNGATALLNPYVHAVSTTSFTVGLGTVAAASQANTVYAVNWLVTPVG